MSTHLTTLGLVILPILAYNIPFLISIILLHILIQAFAAICLGLRYLPQTIIFSFVAEHYALSFLSQLPYCLVAAVIFLLPELPHIQIFVFVAFQYTYMTLPHYTYIFIAAVAAYFFQLPQSFEINFVIVQ
ncbi:hypothetical protein [Butyrivibrio sp. INlla16]|uniref:hypothetical protein n=1 Tax=Butyrivibrio sp. INlla16 TaxID=1520807 RepID=UPI0008843205|nr:hypothetical protein [Butyrivibrio sp. INlla16]SDB69524.1 hypothetical protein SAMN02910263_04462 [Butyrivibrio sp. INlla16]